MQTAPNEPTYSLSEADQFELDKLVSVLELSDSMTTIFAIAPESSPQHPVVEELKSRLSESEEGFWFRNFFYSDDSLHNFFYGLDEARSPQPPTPHNPPLVRGERGAMESRLVVMVFGIEQLPRPRRVDELRRLNLGRDSLFKRDLVLIFWLNRVEFLDEFRHRAPDFWDWRGKVVQFEARPRFNPLLYPYLEWLIAENSYLKISGVMQVQRQVDIFLDQIYVSLQAVRRQQVMDTSERSHRELERMTSRHIGRRGSSALDELELLDEVEPLVPDFVPSEVSTKTVTQKVDLSQAVRENQYCVILGAPGAGKTTLLRYLALHFGMAKRDEMEVVAGGEGLEELGKPLLPVFFRIADYAERLAQEPDLSLLEYLRQFYRQWEVYFENSHPDLPPQPPLVRGESELEGGGNSDIPQLLCEQMRLGQCLMLLDGLDEVFSQESRRLIVERINQFVEEFSANKFVVTSRIAGYRDVKLSERFAEFTIEDMGSEQVEGFLHRWCRAVEQAQQPEASEEQWQRVGDEQTREILGAIQANEGVKRLTANPLLLTILALIHRNGSRLPHRRVELYALAVKTLTEDWQLGKKLPDAPQVMLKESEVVELLAPLAYWMHEEKPSGVVTQAEAEEQLAATLAELNDDEPDSDSVRQAVEQFLRKVRETTGLFVERAPGVYGFMHLTFEEYFAARYIADHERSEILELIRKHLHEPRWDEPILLALGYYGVHSPRQVNKLVEELFRNLEGYELAIEGGEIKIKNASSPDAVLIWSASQDESADNPLELRLKDLLFAGEVLTQVEVNSRIRLKLIEKLVLTLVLGTALQGDTTEGIEKIITLLRQIEVFNQKGEVIDQLKQVGNDSRICDLGRTIAQLVILYVACGETGSILVNCATDIINQLNPLLFRGLKGMVTECGEEITPALEYTLRVQLIDRPSQQAVTFLTALSYIRTDHYGKAIALLEQLDEQQDQNLSPFIAWALATCYQAQDHYEKALEYYGQSWDRLATYPQHNALLYLWGEWGICYRLYTKYEQSLDCFQKGLAIAQELNRLEDKASILYEMSRSYQAWGKYQQAEECQLKDLAIRQQLEDQPNIADAYYQLGRIYQAWGKYEQAIAHYQQSRELYEQLGEEKNVANQWYWLSDCYRNWGKYEQAIECQQMCLAIRQTLDDQSLVARTYYQLGRIYQTWGKYEQAITYHQQSRDLYEQLGREKNVAYQWDNLSRSYRAWGKYEQAVECQQQRLLLYQKLEDQPGIADVYDELGRIYQAWSKYEEAITHYQKSRQVYEQLGKAKDVASRWYNLADCYRDWGKHQQAIECQQQCLTIRQTLDDQSSVAVNYYHLGRIYQAWGKYEEAIAQYQKSREVYEQLGEDKDVANQWYNLADCYQDWGKYEQALDCELKDLALCQKLEDKSEVAWAYYKFGRIYQAWGKYEQALTHYQQSLNLYEQLGKDKDVASQWYNLANCYREWGKYEQAIECQQQCLRIRQALDDQSWVALTYYQLGRIYQTWGKYEQAITYHQQSRDLYEQLGREKNVAYQWDNLSRSYRAWGKYEQAVECQQQRLLLYQKLEDQPGIADVYDELGRIYQAWSKYEEAITHYQQSCELYEQLEKEQGVARLWSWLAACYRDWGKYEQAIEYCQQSLTLCQKLGLEQGSAWNFRAIANTQRLLAKNTPDTAEASNLLTQAEQNIRQAIQLNTAGDYKENLAYDYTTLGLLHSERLRLFPPDDSSLPEQIAQFENYYNTGLTYLTELGQTVDRAEETLDMARAYLEVNVLENCDRAEALAQESLQIFQVYNRRQLEAAAHKLLGEIYLKRAQRNQPNAEAIAHQFLSESLHLYRELDLTEKAAEVEQLIPIS